MAGSARTAVAVLLVGAVLTGCGALRDAGQSPVPAQAAPTSPAPSPTPSPAPAPAPVPVPVPAPAPAPAVPTADAVRSTGTVVEVDGRAVLHALALGIGATVDVAPDGDVVVLTVAPGADGPAVGAVLAAPTGGSVALQDDGSLVVLTGDGTFVGGAARPRTGAGGGPVTVSEVADGVVSATAEAGALRVRVGGRALAGAEWGEREGGRSLAVTPAPWAREAGQAGEAGVWTELLAAVPEADTRVMRDQLTCHAVGAPDKESWNVEPWRPDVGLFAVLAAACNPT